jgi:hypothetical protein
VLAGLEHPGADLDVHGRDGQVQHGVDVVRGEQLVDRPRDDALLGRHLRGPGRVEVRDRHEPQVREGRERREVLRRDVPDTDDAETHG